MDILFSAVIILFGQCKKNNVTYIKPFRARGALRNHAKYQFQTCRTGGTQRSKDTNKHLINIEHQYQIFTTSYKILSYSNEQSCLDIGIRNRSRCQSLLGNYSSAGVSEFRKTRSQQTKISGVFSYSAYLNLTNLASILSSQSFLSPLFFMYNY